MKTIRMLVTQPVNFTSGAVFLYAGNDYPGTPDEIADSLIGRGMAVEVTIIDEVKVDRTELEKLTLAELRKLVRPRHIKDYTLLTKKDLIDILAPNIEIEGTVSA